MKRAADPAKISPTYLQKLERDEVHEPSPHVLYRLGEQLDLPYRVIARGFRIFYRPNLWILHSLSPVARYRGRRIYYLFRNKIRISARYLPWRMFAVQLGVWSGYFLKEALRIGRLDAFVAGLASGLAGVPGQLQNRRRDRLSAVAISRLRRLEGRLYY